MLISIIIPCHNVSQYITECIDSCYIQDYKHIEVICIDNNSSDNTLQKLYELKKEHPNLIIEQEQKPGAPSARNKGLKIAHGEWIQFLDADDLLLKSKINHQVKLIKTDTTFIAGACINRDIEGKQSETTPSQGDIFKALFAAKLGNTCSNLWKRSAILKIGGWDETLNSSQEADLMSRLLISGANVTIDLYPLTIVRQRENGQISQRNPSEKWQQLISIRLKLLEKIKKNLPEYYNENEIWYNDNLFAIIRILASHDLNKAYKIYMQQLGSKYKPSKSQTHSTSWYLVLYKVFGFKTAQRIRSKITKLIK